MTTHEAPQQLVGPAAEGITLAIDVETTGLKAETDQIVQIAFIRYSNGRIDGDADVYFCRPTTAVMSPRAQEVHGISMDTLQHHPTFEERAHLFESYFAGVTSLIGYNVKFDIRILSAELERAGLPPLPCRHYNIIDPYEMQNHFEPRTLNGTFLRLRNRQGGRYAMLNHYTSRTLSGTFERLTGEEMHSAHDASADVVATLQVYNRQIGRYDLSNATATDLDRIFWGRKIDLDGKFAWNHEGEVVFNFGAYRGTLVCDEEGVDKRDCLNWMLEQDFSEETKDIAQWAIRLYSNRLGFNQEMSRRRMY